MTLVSITFWLSLAIGGGGLVVAALVLVPRALAGLTAGRLGPGSRVILSYGLMIVGLRLFTTVWREASMLALFGLAIGTVGHIIWFLRAADRETRIAALTLLSIGAGVAVAWLSSQPTPWLFLIVRGGLTILT